MTQPGPGRLFVVLGDQLDPATPAYADFDPTRDVLWMAEVEDEARHVPSHRARIALFLSAMRHFREAQRALGRRVMYRSLGAATETSLAAALASDLERERFRVVICIKPGEWRVERALEGAAQSAGLPLEVRDDPHFLSTPAAFATWAEGRKELRLEYFYRVMRRQTGLLMEGDTPAGGAWNFDAANRGSFGRQGPGMLPAPARFAPDEITREVLELVEQQFPDHPGELAEFDWPVTRDEALLALEDFIEQRLECFGQYQDAMWTAEPWLYHSRISAALNLHLLHPREVCDAAEQAWKRGRAPIEAVEGFIRQVLGWREYVRGLYWLRMPAYQDLNALDAREGLPAFYWNGETPMRCLADSIGQTLRHGYAHHIQRLMVTGLYALLLGVDPRQVHEWYLAVYVDAVEWVELPNVLGMALFADGGVMASKPYAATGKYIDRMSNYCGHCRYRPDQSTGSQACPFTTLYWDFLDRHEERLANHPRMALQVRNLRRLSPTVRESIRARAAELRQGSAG
ncbi:MAG: cryptochrome/photolyase family protein [Steroidobacteraceae bacterium]